MPIVKMLKGLPDSGKSTLAKELVSQGWLRVNKDDMRSMFHGSKHSKSNENFVLLMRDQAIIAGMESFKNIVVDDTNFAPFHEERIRKLVDEFNKRFQNKTPYTIEVELLDTPLDVCITRDVQRSSPVGKKVIMSMYNQYLKKPAIKAEYIDGLPSVILCDIDGTMALIDYSKPNPRSPYDGSRVNEDFPNNDVLAIVNLIRETHHAIVIFVSGRSDSCKMETIDWLNKNLTFNTHEDNLLMRKTGDNRKDNIIKKEIYENHIKGKYNVKFVLDDRQQVVDMWREQGLTCLQVAEGDF